MSLADIGKNDISEETQALKDRLASRDTQNAGLRTQLMRREAELEELQATFNETVYKLSKEAERALRLEEEVSARCSELRTERISLQNSELALQSAQEKLKAEERTKRELESTLDTVSLHSQATSAEHQSTQREKRALEARVRELERIVQTHEAKGISNMPRKNGRPRSSSVSNFRLPAMEQELNDVKSQLRSKDSSLRALEKKFAQAQDDLVKAENARISIDKASQSRISELLSTLERREEELESLRETDNSGEREEELLKRIDEDAAKISALEKLVAETQTTRSSQARVQKLQSQLKAECEKVQRNEDIQNRLLFEKEELSRKCEASRREVAEVHELLLARESQIEELEAKHTLLLTEADTRGRHMESLPLEADSARSPTLCDESAVADHIQTLLQAIDRLRGERDGLKRALEFSEVEYRITTEGFQTRIASLSRQLTNATHHVETDKPTACVELRMKQLTSCAAAFAVVISNLQTHLDLSEGRLSSATADLASSNSQLHDTLAAIDNQRLLLSTNADEHDVLLQKFNAVAKELSESDDERGRLCLQLEDIEGQFTAMKERVNVSETAREAANQSFLLAEERFIILNKSYQDIESERNSLVLQVTNLQDDLVRVREDLAEAQNRYNTLHSQQLSAMSTSEVVRALKDRIKELETRIVHHTDQISDYQHDIRRLEANVKLHEERIAEMMSELDLLASQKEAMVEDCAEAREARDEAMQRLEAAEEEAERIDQQMQQTKHAHEAELAAMSSVLANVTSEHQQTAALLADLRAETAGFIRETKGHNCGHHHLSEQSNAATSRSHALELENKDTETRQAVLSLAIIRHLYKDCTRRLQGSRQRIASLETQVVTLTQELERSRDDLTSSSHMHTEEISSTFAAGQPEEYDAVFLRNLLQEKELELATAREMFEGSQSCYAKVETELLARIATLTEELQVQARQSEDIVDLQGEIRNVKAQLQTSLENFANLEKLHDDVVEDFATVREVFERRLSDTDEGIRSLEADHHRSLATLGAKYRHQTDILTGDLEDREHELDELRQQLHGLSEVHARAERKLHEELNSYRVSHALANNVEKDLRRTVADIRQQLDQAETESLALQEERQLLQTEITGLQAEIQRSTSLTRYLESQVRESEDACALLKETLHESELTLAESEKAGKAAEFNLTLQVTQHEKVVAALRREIASLQSGPELRSALADSEEKNRELDDLLRAKCQEIEEYDDRILETLKANKKLTNKVESLTRKVQALQAKLASVKNQPQEPVAEVILAKKTPSASTSSPPTTVPTAKHAVNYASSSHIRDSSGPSKPKTPEPRIQSVAAPAPSRTPSRTSEPTGVETSVGKKRPAPDDDERDGVPAEGHYSMDAYLRNGPTPRLRRAHGHPAGFTPVRGASLRKATGLSSPGRRMNTGATPSEVITDVTNSPRGSSGHGDAQLKKRSWLGKIRGGTGSQPASSRLGALGGQ